MLLLCSSFWLMGSKSTSLPFPKNKEDSSTVLEAFPLLYQKAYLKQAHSSVPLFVRISSWVCLTSGTSVWCTTSCTWKLCRCLPETLLSLWSNSYIWMAIFWGGFSRIWNSIWPMLLKPNSKTAGNWCHSGVRLTYGLGDSHTQAKCWPTTLRISFCSVSFYSKSAD